MLSCRETLYIVMISLTTYLLSEPWWGGGCLQQFGENQPSQTHPSKLEGNVGEPVGLQRLPC